MLGEYYKIIKEFIDRRAWLKSIMVVLGFAMSLIMSGLVVGLIVNILDKFNIVNSENAFITSFSSASIYLLTIFLLFKIPKIFKRASFKLSDLGLGRSMLWSDILMAIISFVFYIVLSSFIIMLISSFVPDINNLVQETGFEGISTNFERYSAFISLVIVAPVLEEVLFRGYLYNKLKKFLPLIPTFLLVSLLFGALHGQLNLLLDTFALSMVACWLRYYTGSIWSSIMLHSIKNAIAFFMVFIYPLILATLG